jgi:hypothetical protein
MYGFLSQVIPYQDSDLEQLYTYLRFLLTKATTKRAPEMMPGLIAASRAFQCSLEGPFFWSGREDSNLRPLGPEPSALPG